MVDNAVPNGITDQSDAKEQDEGVGIEMNIVGSSKCLCSKVSMIPLSVLRKSNRSHFVIPQKVSTKISGLRSN